MTPFLPFITIHHWSIMSKCMPVDMLSHVTPTCYKNILISGHFHTKPSHFKGVLDDIRESSVLTKEYNPHIRLISVSLVHCSSSSKRLKVKLSTIKGIDPPIGSSSTRDHHHTGTSSHQSTPPPQHRNVCC